MATKPYFLWGDTHTASASASAAAFDSDAAAVYGGSRAPETAALLAAATAAGDTAAVAPELGAEAVARPRMRRNPSASASGKQQQQPQQAGGGGGAKKPPQRGLGVAELERLRCGDDPLRELLVDAAGAQGHPLLQYHHHHHHLQVPPSAFDSTASARYCSQLLAPAPGPAPLCFLHTPAAAPLVAPEQQYFRDRWGRMGGFPPAGNGSGGGADHQPQLLPAPEHPSSQNTIWRPAASSPSSCLHTGHRCDICCRRMRAALAERGALAPTPPPASPNTAAGSNTDATPDYSINDLAAAMAAARQVTASTYQQCNCSFISQVICPCARNDVLLPARESFAQLRCVRPARAGRHVLGPGEGRRGARGGRGAGEEGGAGDRVLPGGERAPHRRRRRRGRPGIRPRRLGARGALLLPVRRRRRRPHRTAARPVSEAVGASRRSITAPSRRRRVLACVSASIGRRVLCYNISILDRCVQKKVF
ncbi:uncharacterized protein LOC120701301 isoform X1 [Panicum virgatum]|uniref:uncharacterized protein LOC120701301 isoform X1 n=1 Tax=Panicum virgatum TaxID=38727 RepID=UPI0019D53599|nr:uncharacterized protein LOC120701301 isoform X1 [Panicum virgatum]